MLWLVGERVNAQQSSSLPAAPKFMSTIVFLAVLFAAFLHAFVEQYGKIL